MFDIEKEILNLMEFHGAMNLQQCFFSEPRIQSPPVVICARI